MGVDPSPMRLVVEVGEEDPVRGTVTGPAGDVHRYVGWLALIGAVEEMRRPLQDATEPKERTR